MKKRINELNLLQKVMLSIFPVLATLFFLDVFIVYGIPYEYYNKAWIILFFLMIIQNVILILRISKKETDIGNKLFYIILVFSIALFQLYYVWVLDKNIKNR